MKTRDEIFDGLKKAIREMEVRNIDLTQPSWEAIILAAAYLEGKYHWIPVEERLPKEQGKYMFHFSNGDMCYEAYYPKLKLLGNVTHWMEIVPPRKEDKK